MVVVVSQLRIIEGNSVGSVEYVSADLVDSTEDDDLPGVPGGKEDGTGRGTGEEVMGTTLGDLHIRKLGGNEGSWPILSCDSLESVIHWVFHEELGLE